MEFARDCRLAKRFLLALVIIVQIFSACWVKDIDEDARRNIDEPTILDREKYWHLVGKNGINITKAWEITHGSLSVRIAVIDDEFFPDAEIFRECKKTYQHLDFVGGQRSNTRHGIGVVSILSACPKNSWEIVGVNNVSPILMLEFGDNRRHGMWALALWAMGEFDCHDKQFIDCPSPIDKPVDIINMSLGVKYEDFKSASPFFNISALAAKNDTILVATAGNDGENADVKFPAGATGVISVGAVTKDGVSVVGRNWSSNFGHTVEIMAPGEDILYATKDGPDIFGGTSFAAPIITGVISLMKSVYRELNWKTAVYFLQSTAVPMDCEAYCVGRAQCQRDCCVGEKQVCTPGRVDAGAAVMAAHSALRDGLPKVALIDASDYAIYLKPEMSAAGMTELKGMVSVKNVGGKKGRYRITSANAKIKVNPTEIELFEKGHPNDSAVLTITSSDMNVSWSRITIKSPETGVSAGFSDEIMLLAGPK